MGDNEISNLTYLQKTKIWVDYMVTIVALNNDIHYYPIMVKDVNNIGNVVRSTGTDFNNGKSFPLLNIHASSIDRKHCIMTFDDFCNEKIYDWYGKFKSRILL